MSWSATNIEAMSVPSDGRGDSTLEGHALAHDAKENGGRDRHDEIDGDRLQILVESVGRGVDEIGGTDRERRCDENGGAAQQHLEFSPESLCGSRGGNRAR